MKGHGTAASYKRGCRCDECRKANTDRCRAAKARRLAKEIPAHIQHGNLSTATNWQCKCDPCLEVVRQRNTIVGNPDHFKKAYVQRHPERYADAIRKYVRRTQDESLAGAYRSGSEWTGPELETAARDDLTARQIAALTGRTVYAVRGMRRKLKNSPREQRMAGTGRGYQ